MSNTPNTIKSILNNLVWNVEAAVDGDEVDKAAQLIHQLIEREVIGESEIPIMAIGYIEQRGVSQRKLIEKQRQRLASLMKGESK